MRYFCLNFCFIMLIFTTASYSAWADKGLVCQIWFEAQDFGATDNCALECVTAEVSNTYCVDSCVSLCCKAEQMQSLLKLDGSFKNQSQEDCLEDESQPVYYSGYELSSAIVSPQKTINKHELWLMIRHPFKMFRVYMLGQKALEVCQTFYPLNKKPVSSALEGSVQNACDHFIWSALLYKQFGLHFSKKVLSAHEENPEQLFSHKLMDMNRFNNYLAIN